MLKSKRLIPNITRSLNRCTPVYMRAQVPVSVHRYLSTFDTQFDTQFDINMPNQLKTIMLRAFVLF